ncbi:uncharacterized protein LOC110760362 isoform X2 [Prunus avium]|uniref:Uncharacterized protein LOC110760362 isoform X2 n=1 Tax=Prunus avium TaxID=42229 RepID=A0A6P5SN41_PRUAV|nr:uncharacterized protein LOC110760362 isoform X2 [Prunus avium]
MGDSNTSQPSASADLLPYCHPLNRCVNFSPFLEKFTSTGDEVLHYVQEVEKSMRELCERTEMEIPLGEVGKILEINKSLAVLSAQQMQLVDLMRSMSEQFRLIQSTLVQIQQADNPYPRFCEREKNQVVGLVAARIRSNLYVLAQDCGFIIDTKTMSRCSSFTPPIKHKRSPLVVSAYDKLYCLACPSSFPPNLEASFERYDPDKKLWEIMPSYPFYNDYDTYMNITGYAICYGVILFSLCASRGKNFDVVAFHISRNQWKPVEIDISVCCAPFKGRAVVVGERIYSVHGEELIAFGFKMYKGDDGSLVYFLSQLFVLEGLEIAHPPLPYGGKYKTEYLVHLGNSEFFYVKTRRTLLSVQYLCITTFRIVVEEAGSLKMKTIHSTVRSVDIQCGEWFNLISCFMPGCEDYEPKEEETSLDESFSMVNHRRMAKKQAGRGIAAREPELFSVRNRKSQAS